MTADTDFDALWNYQNPGATRDVFEKLLADPFAQSHSSYFLQLLTQIARTYSLQSQFQAAHALLDRVKPLLEVETPIVSVRYLLERGRTFRSAGDKTQAKLKFAQAFFTAQDHGLLFYAVDAAHMLALVAPDESTKKEWTEKGIALAEASDDPKVRKWLGVFYNNHGWDHFDNQDFSAALELFEKAERFYLSEGSEEHSFTARWTVARTLRSLGRTFEALEIQLRLEEELAQENRQDGYVFEELAELFDLIPEKRDRAGHYFTQAFALLSKEPGFKEREELRYKRLEAESRRNS